MHPVVKDAVPDYIFTVVGRGDLSSFARLSDDCLNIVGEVKDLSTYINSARVGIAPALGGSGFRGKINQYAIYSVPSVVTPLASKGLGYTDQFNIFISEDPVIFAKHCIDLLLDDELNMRIGGRARSEALKRFTWHAKLPAIEAIYGLKGVQS